MDTGRKIDWLSQEAYIFLNPKFSDQEKTELIDLSNKFSRPGVLWIASSGSSKTVNESVKLVALSKQAFLASAKAVNQHLQATKNDIWLQCLPNFHVGGLSIYARAFLENSKVVDLEKWDSENFCNACEQNQVTLSAMVSAQLFDLVAKKILAPKSLRALVLGGGRLESSLYEKAVELGWPVLPSFGMTELCSQIATAKLDSWKSKDQRLFLLSHIQASVGPDNALKISSPALLEGYAQVKNNQGQWIQSVVDGWLQTQDLVELRGTELVPLGRATNYVKVLGEGVNLDLVQQRFDDLLGTDIDKLRGDFYITAQADDRSGNKIVLVIHVQAAAEVQAKLMMTVKSYNLNVVGYEKIQEIQTVEAISWKRKSPEKW